MPTFVVQTLGRAANKVSVETSPIRIGRDDENDIVLPDETVSRQHAVVLRSADGTWSIGCVSETNPIVVNGRLSRESVSLVEGSEILVGSAFLLIFSEDPYKADGYINTKNVFVRSRCSGCSWEGMISTARKNATCPRCNGAAFVEVDGYSGEARRALPQADARAPRLRTAAVDPEEARRMMKAIKAANRSHIERVDAHVGPSPRTELTESKPTVLGRSADPMLTLHGLVFGSVTVAWNGERYVAQSALVFPAMKINGAKAKSTALTSGDVIGIGRNEFKFVTE